jgi:hypothetical protein
VRPGLDCDSKFKLSKLRRQHKIYVVIGQFYFTWPTSRIFFRFRTELSRLSHSLPIYKLCCKVALSDVLIHLANLRSRVRAGFAGDPGLSHLATSMLPLRGKAGFARGLKAFSSFDKNALLIEEKCIQRSQVRSKGSMGPLAKSFKPMDKSWRLTGVLYFMLRNRTKTSLAGPTRLH